MKHIHTLTGLRGLAALIVFISHSANEGLLPRWFGEGFGQIGVMIFFVLSGFLMSFLYLHQDFTYENMAKYCFARIGRVFPLYLAALTASVLLSNFVYREFVFRFDDPGVVLRAYCFVSAPYVFWTIPVEVQFYVIFLVFWFLFKRGAKPIYLAGLMLLTMVPSLVVIVMYRQVPRIVSSYSYAFFIGAVTAAFYHQLKDNPRLARFAAMAGVPLTLLLFLNLPELREASGLTAGPGIYAATWFDPLSWAIVYLLFLCAVLNSRGLGYLNWRPFVFLGEVSYGFYLLHYPILMFFCGLDWHPVGALCAAFVGTCAVSQLSFRYFERPVADRIRSVQLPGIRLAKT